MDQPETPEAPEPREPSGPTDAELAADYGVLKVSDLLSTAARAVAHNLPTFGLVCLVCLAPPSLLGLIPDLMPMTYVTGSAELFELRLPLLAPLATAHGEPAAAFVERHRFSPR